MDFANILLNKDKEIAAMGRPRKNRPDGEFDPVENPYPFLGEKERFLIGWPGYRTRPEKSGLAPVDSQAELGHIQGVLFRYMITGKFKIRNPIYLVGLSFYGILLVSPVLILTVPEGRFTFLASLSFFVPNLVIGILMLVNIVLSLINYKEGESITGD